MSVALNKLFEKLFLIWWNLFALRNCFYLKTFFFIYKPIWLGRTKTLTLSLSRLHTAARWGCRAGPDALWSLEMCYYMQCQAAPWGHLCRLQLNNLKRDENKWMRCCNCVVVLVQKVQILFNFDLLSSSLSTKFWDSHNNISVLGKKDHPCYLFQVWQYYLLPPEEQRMPGVKNPMCSAFPRVGEWSI